MLRQRPSFSPRNQQNLLGAVALATLSLSISLLETSLAQEARVQVLGLSAESLSGESGEGAAEQVANFAFSSAGGSFSLGGLSLGGVNPDDRSQLFNLLANDSVKQELQLTDEQLGGVRQIMKASQQRLTSLIRESMRDRADSGAPVRLDGEELRNLMLENRDQAEAAIEEILLPEQLKRIRQLAYQVQIAREGLGQALVSGRLGQEIGVHEDQKQQLLDRAAKIDADARQAIIAIRVKAREQLLAELTPEQRNSAESLLGPYFEYEEASLGQQLQQAMKRPEEQAAGEEASTKH